MKRLAAVMAVMVTAAGAWGQKAPLLGEKDVAAIAGEISGATAKRNLEGIAAFHRQRGSQGFHEAAELVAGKLKEYGLSDVAILQFPADGKIFYGTQRSRPAWDAEVGELTRVADGSAPICTEDWRTILEKEHAAGKVGVLMSCPNLLESYEKEPVVLAEDSESADVTADLVDVGAGTSESDYAGKEVKGKIVLVSEQPGAVQDLAMGKFGAVGIVSYAQNQKTAWSGENLDAVRWGHLETFSENKTFGFMVSLRKARALQERLAKGEKIKLHAVVKAGQHPGNYEVVTATIPGADEKLKNEEIAYSCHLDHQRPGANDNASGCATILEVARTLQKLIATGKLARPARTIRFIFPPEIEGTMALLTGHGFFGNHDTYTASDGQKMASAMDGEFVGPELAKRIKAVVHMDMVGGDPETKAVFHVTRGPLSKPSFVQDVAWAFAEWVNEETYAYAATGKAEFPLVEAEGGKEPLRAEYSAYTMGSDHDVYQDSSFGIPAIYLNDWPDRFIHTNLDTPGNIDATKLKRVGLIGAASGYFLAGMTEQVVPRLLQAIEAAEMLMAHKLEQYRLGSPEFSTGDADRFRLWGNLATVKSVEKFAGVPVELSQRTQQRLDALYIGDKGVPLKTLILSGAEERYKRLDNIKGPMTVFGYDYFEEQWKKRGHNTRPKLLDFVGARADREEYAYEVLNLVDGQRLVWQITDDVSAEYGPVPMELVVEYLKALEEIGVVEEVK
jgi:aminopeptidase YwaD